MFVEFTVGNYRSFKEPQTFSMEATKLKAAAVNKTLDENVVFEAEKKLHLLTSAALYGANSSGKSNLIMAWKFFRDMIINSARESQAGDEIEVEPFELAIETLREPSFFEAVFIVSGKRYRYKVETNNKRILSEHLYRNGARGEVVLFEREEQKIEVNEKSFKEGKGLEQRVRPNALFLSVLAQFNGRIANSIFYWFSSCSIVSGLSDSDYRSYTIFVLKHTALARQVKELVRNLDINVQDLDLVQREIPSRKLKPKMQISLFDDMQDAEKPKVSMRETIETTHSQYNSDGVRQGNVKFDITKQESAGTQKLIYFAGLLLYTIETGGLLFVDELDARLHPLMTCAIINLFNDKKTNPRNAQLIFTTHDTNLLANHIFRRDQIWFAEKDEYQASHLYSLAEFVDEKGAKARNDDNLERNYIEGRFGSIPFVSNLHRAVEEMVSRVDANIQEDDE
ncbi:hypothetical protein B1R32_107109 [Abditibacterium utsteinense]|uniref:ATPase AAA-type core domain-containing protein n=1 Tax=Abditibacterium utsteinense TaxID=1960156 RepID=A0A2S8STF1_9BACT|nr:ATP-binding protein [Abditibacterium utsteinense]PQV64084.1 hypothetical protein B1R32_107109 [Abditibacterium utsteinense]